MKKLRDVIEQWALEDAQQERDKKDSSRTKRRKGQNRNWSKKSKKRRHGEGRSGA